MKKSTILLLFFSILLIFNCSSVTTVENSIIIKTRRGSFSRGEEYESTKYFYLANCNKKEIDSFMSNSSRGINETIRMLIEKFNAIPIFDEPVRFWDGSCEKKQFNSAIDYGIEYDTKRYKIVEDNLKNDSNFKRVENGVYKPYKIYFYYRKVKKIEFCTVESTFSYSDSCIIIKKLKW